MGSTFFWKLFQLSFVFILSFYPHPRTCLLILERGSEGKKREENISVREKHWLLPPICTLTVDQTHNLAMCPDQEDQDPLVLQDDVPSHTSQDHILFLEMTELFESCSWTLNKTTFENDKCLLAKMFLYSETVVV